MNRRVTLGLLPLVLASGLGYSDMPTLPIWLAAVSGRFHLTTLQDGMLGSMEFGCLAVSSIFAAALLRSNRGAFWLVLAIILSVAGNIGSAFCLAGHTGSVRPIDLWGFIASRAVVGTSYGLMLADVTHRAAQASTAHRTFSMQQLGLVVFAVIFFSTFSPAARASGPSILFIYYVVLGLLALVSVMYLPSPAGAAHASMPLRGASAFIGRRASALLALIFAAIALSFAAQGSVFTYIAMAARATGVQPKTLGAILAAGSIANLTAPLAAALIGLRLGRAAPVTLGFVGLMLSATLIGLRAGPAWFAAGTIGINWCILFLPPYLLGTLAKLDSSGRGAAAGPAFLTIGGALGPVMGGFLLSSGGYTLLSAVAAVIMGSALTLTLIVTARIPSAVSPRTMGHA